MTGWAWWEAAAFWSAAVFLYVAIACLTGMVLGGRDRKEQ